MDSRAYAAFIEETRRHGKGSRLPVPFVFVSTPPSDTPAHRAAAADFLRQMLDHAPDGTGLPQPALLRTRETNLFCRLFRLLHDSIARLIHPGAAELRDHERRSLAELARLLLGVAHPRQMPVFREGDALAHAMATLAFEAFAHWNLCPSAMEGQCKRAAHACYARMRKALLACDTPTAVSALCYVWCAWILAAKTEGVQEQPLAREQGGRIHDTFRWRDSGHTITCALSACNDLSLTRLAVFGPAATGQPFQIMEHADQVGLALTAGGQALTMVECSPVEDIVRRTIRGTRVRARWGLRDPLIDWTVVVLAYRRTLYRIDIMQPAAGTPVAIQARLALETPAPLSPDGSGRLVSASGPGRMVLEIPENPLKLAPSTDRQPHGIVLLAGEPVALGQGLQSVVAWAQGAGVADIDRTNLLGIHDMG